MKKTLSILFGMVICLSADDAVTPISTQVVSMTETTALSQPIFKKGKAKAQRKRRYDRPNPASNQRRNMRIQRRNGIGYQPVVSTLNQQPA